MNDIQRVVYVLSELNLLIAKNKLKALESSTKSDRHIQILMIRAEINTLILFIDKFPKLNE